MMRFLWCLTWKVHMRNTSFPTFVGQMSIDISLVHPGFIVVSIGIDESFVSREPHVNRRWHCVGLNGVQTLETIDSQAYGRNAACHYYSQISFRWRQQEKWANHSLQEWFLTFQVTRVSWLTMTRSPLFGVTSSQTAIMKRDMANLRTEFGV